MSFTFSFSRVGCLMHFRGGLSKTVNKMNLMQYLGDKVLQESYCIIGAIVLS